MSIHVMSWVLKHSETTLGQRLVLLSLAEFAHDDGTNAYPSIATLQQRARLSERQVQYALRALTESGAIEQTGKTSRGCHVYRVVMERGADIAPLEPRGGASECTPGVQPTAPDPSVEPLELPPLVSPPAEVAVFRPWSVDRKPVSVDEDRLAAEVLRAYNDATGQSRSSRDTLRMIVGRIREHPELTLEQYTFVICHAVANPWWDDHTNPNVIFGNGSIFESSLEAAKAAAAGKAPPGKQALRYGRGMTTRQMLEATKGMR